MSLKTVMSAKEIALSHLELSARDAIHVATMKENGVSDILSFDTGYDAIAGVTRINA